MQAIILAAGVGSRLKKLTGGSSKSLVEVGGRPLILHTLEALADHGVGPVMVIVGHEADEVQRVIGERAETLLNERFTETNSLYSLWLAREWITGPFVLLNCDLFFDPKVLDVLLEEPGNVLAYDSTSSRGREQTKVAIKQRRVVDIGKDLPPASARGESLGMLKFDEDGARAMFATADHLICDGHEQAWVMEATRAVCAQVPVYGINVAGAAWTEIDFPYDLDVARREVWPVIWKGRWRKQVYWRRTRWLAAGAVALTLALTGWIANSKVGPASMNWETVAVAGGDAVRLGRSQGKPQLWSSIGGDSVVAATVTGAMALVETRLLLPDSARRVASRFVVGVTLDGDEYDWRSLAATPDTAVSLPGGGVGDRDRIEVPLSPDHPHRITVRLIAPREGRLLVRIRQAEEREP